MDGNPSRRLFLVANLLAQVTLVARFLHPQDLRLKPVDMSFLIAQKPLEQFARGIVTLVLARG
jgi:hypothetical protein